MHATAPSHKRGCPYTSQKRRKMRRLCSPPCDIFLGHVPVLFFAPQLRRLKLPWYSKRCGRRQAAPIFYKDKQNHKRRMIETRPSGRELSKKMYDSVRVIYGTKTGLVPLSLCREFSVDKRPEGSRLMGRAQCTHRHNVSFAKTSKPCT